jgi:hypothetical protein
MELLLALYFSVMKVRPQEPDWPERDRFILSKGHCAIGLYTVLALRGFLPIEELKTFDKAHSRLQGHPDVTKLPGLETSTGSLGQGLSFGLGIALGARLRGSQVSHLCSDRRWRAAGRHDLGRRCILHRATSSEISRRSWTGTACSSLDGRWDRASATEEISAIPGPVSTWLGSLNDWDGACSKSMAMIIHTSFQRSIR